jgi:protein-disulfide isomerase
VPFPALREALVQLGPALTKCFEKGRAQAPKLEGDVTLIITIAPASTGGRAEDVQVEGYTLHHPFVVSCIAQAVAAHPFPAPGSTRAKVLVPLEFKARGAAGEEGVQVFVPSVDGAPASMHMPDRVARVQVNTAHAATVGAVAAPVTLVAFIDFECTFCQKAWAVLEQLMVQYDGRVRFVFLQRPLPFHKGARKAAEAAQAASQQGRFKEFAALLFAEQSLHDDAGLDSLARRAGLDLQRFRGAMADGRAARAVDAHSAEADRLGAKGTPTFFINGKEMVGARPLATFQQLLDAELAASP